MLGPPIDMDLSRQGVPMFRSNASTVSLFVLMMLSPVELVAAAAPDAEVSAITVRYRSADLDTAHGIAILYRRIHSAASSLCGIYDGVLVQEKEGWDKCVGQTVGRAVAAVHSDALTAYHGRRFRTFALAGAPGVRSSTKH
jgi:UrcA family protein